MDYRTLKKHSNTQRVCSFLSLNKKSKNKKMSIYILMQKSGVMRMNDKKFYIKKIIFACVLIS